MRTRIAPALVLAAVAVSLAACTPPGGSPTPVASAAGLAGCVTGHTWDLDVDDAASQILAHFQSLGLPVTTVTGSGTESMTWGTDGAVDIETSLTYDIAVNQNADTTLVISQHHEGPAVGNFQIEGTQAIPSDWDASGYQVTTTSTINGEPAGSAPFDFPDSQLAGVTLELTCSDSQLTSKASDGYVDYRWTRD